MDGDDWGPAVQRLPRWVLSLVVGVLLGALLCGVAHADARYPGFTVIGANAGGATVSCTPGAQLMYLGQFETAPLMIPDGLCPSSGSVVCGGNTTMWSGGHPYDVRAGDCLEAMVGGEGGGSSTDPNAALTAAVTGLASKVESSSNAWQLSAADGALVAGAVAGVWMLAWAWRALMGALN